MWMKLTTAHQKYSSICIQLDKS